MEEIKENCIDVKDYLTKSNLPASDYVINPYIGCPHACKYCYACFMKRFTGHDEEWGSFIDIKQCNNPINKKKIHGKNVFLSSVTDCYNPFEEKYGITKGILQQLVDVDFDLCISTKSSLILRDIELLKKYKSLKVAISLNTLSESFKNDMDKASSIDERLKTMQALNDAGIYTVLFISPIFPGITDFKKIVDKTKNYINEYWFENLNLRGNYKKQILSYINLKFPSLSDLYTQIYSTGDKSFWRNLTIDIEEYCNSNNIKYINYFYHEVLVQEKINKRTIKI